MKRHRRRRPAPSKTGLAGEQLHTPRQVWWTHRIVRSAVVLGFVILVAAGCGGEEELPPPFEPKSTCPGFRDALGFGTGHIYGEETLDCAWVEKVLDLAHSSLVQRKLIDAGRWISVFGPVSVYVHATPKILATNIRDYESDADPDVRYVGGARTVNLSNKNAPALIRVGSEMTLLLHELLHELDYANGFDRVHEGWAENGYTAADEAFRRRVVKIP